VPNVEDAHLVSHDFVIDLVWITRERQLTDSSLIGLRRHVREIGEPPDLPLYRGLYVFCRSWLPPFKIFKNIFKIGTRTKRIPDSHSP
jgi:hypothetical protein